MSILDEHFRNPSNAGVLEDADLRVEVENPVCGDLLRLFIARDEEGLVRDARSNSHVGVDMQRLSEVPASLRDRSERLYKNACP